MGVKEEIQEMSHRVAICLGSRIPDISERKSGHFQKVALILNILGLKRIQNDYLGHSST